MSSTPLHRVFVYGTLRTGEPNHHLLDGLQSTDRILTEPSFELVDLGAYPAMVDGGDTAVVGEVYRVDADLLATLDRLEGHPHFYERRPIPLADGSESLAYLLPRTDAAGYPRIPGGDWLIGSREK